jgi:hypothetical protein
MNYFVSKVPLGGDTSKTKNKILREFLKKDKDYIFLIEDNCDVLDEKVFNKFIDISRKTGIETLMWAKGGVNRKLEFDLDPYIDYYSDFSTAFAMYTKNSIKTVGLFDEEMPKNTWQELEHAKRAGDVGLSTPFGMFASPKNIDEYLSIKYPKDEFKNLKQMDEGLTYWENKDMEDFPIDIPKQKTRKFEMI